MAMALHKVGCGCPSGIRMPPACASQSYDEYLVLARAALRQAAKEKRQS